jgi:ABC-2 type transport system ATP-binding protein
MLDPIARHDFMATVQAAATADGVSVVLSSHVLTELERVASYLVLISRGQVRLAGQVDDLLATHGQASLEELALNNLRDNPAEVTQ